MKNFDDLTYAVGENLTVVYENNTALAVGSGSLLVFATPAMIALLEGATVKAIEPFLDEGETTVGTKIDVSHSKATPLGVEVKAVAKLVEVDGRALTFSVEAFDSDNNLFGRGKIIRFLVIAEKFMKKLEK